jgi:Ala-tRNA(Pro) deacylase
VGTADFTRELIRERVDYELITHPHTESARAEALEVGLAEVGKTVVLTTGSGFVRAVVPTSERVDLHKVRALIGGGKAVRLANEIELAGAYPMFELGAVPPFGGPSGDRTILDRQLAGREWIVLEAGSHEQSVRLRTRDIVRLGDAVIADLCED